MGTFVTGNTPLPARKANAHPPVDPSIEIDAEDVNGLWDAAGDLRTAVIGTQGDVQALRTDVTATQGDVATAQANIAALQAAPSPSIPPRRTAPDASDLLVYTFDEAVSPWANTGAAGATGNSLALSGTGTLPITMPGLFESGANLGNGIDFNAGTTVHVDGAANVEPTGPFTVTTWHLPRTLNATGGVPFFLKGYRPGGPATDPFWSAGLDIDTTGYLRFAFKVTGNPTRIVQIATLGKPIIGAWNYVGVTFSGTGTTQLMLNGKIVATFTGYSATPIDWGTHGTWAVGGTPTGNTGSTVDGLIDEFRVANVVRPASYFAAVWKAGMML